MKCAFLLQFDEGNLRWSDSVPSLFTMSMEPETADTDSSSSTIDHTPMDRVTTPPGHMLSIDMLKGEGMLGLSPEAVPALNIDTLLSRKSDTLRAFTSDDALVSDLHDHLILSDGEQFLFCDCPPDPELTPEINLKAIV